jgi:hypothetical protein
MKPVAKDNIIENIDDAEAVKTLLNMRPNIAISKAADLVFMRDRPKDLTGFNNDKVWSDAKHKRKTIVKEMFRKWDDQKK